LSNFLIFLTVGLTVIGLIYSSRRKWIILSLAFFFSNMMPANWYFLQNDLIDFFQVLRSESRFLCVSLVFSLVFSRKIETILVFKRPPTIIFIFFLLQIYLLLLDVFRTSGIESQEIIFRMIVDFIFFLSLGIKLQDLLINYEDIKWLVRGIAGGGFILAMVTVIQLMSNSDAIIWRGRLLGVTAHPNFSAIIFASTIVPSFWLIQINDKFFEKMFWFLSAVLCFIFLIWTGSRNGCLMLLINIFVYFLKTKRGLILFITTLIAFGIFTYFSSQVDDSMIRLLSGQNTRSVAWHYLLSNFLSNPIFGMPTDEIIYSENSFLLIAARGGIFSLVVILTVTALVFIKINSLKKIKNKLSFNIYELILSCFCSFFVGAFFEGYLNSTVDYSILYFYCFVVLLQRAPYLELGLIKQPTIKGLGLKTLKAEI
jgi:hypothetical protein